jgi:hypothetical protein
MREYPADCVGKSVVGLRLVQTQVRRAVVKASAMLMHARSLRSRHGKRGTQTGNQGEYECDSQFHIASLAVDMTRGRDARIQEFVVSCSCLANGIRYKNATDCSGCFWILEPPPLASDRRDVYCQTQDDFYLLPLRICVPLLALLWEPGRGIGGVDI